MESQSMITQKLHNDVLVLVDWVHWARGLAGGPLYCDEISLLDVCNRIANDGRIEEVLAQYAPRLCDETHATVQPCEVDARETPPRMERDEVLNKDAACDLSRAHKIVESWPERKRETADQILRPSASPEIVARLERDDEFYHDMSRQSDR